MEKNLANYWRAGSRITNPSLIVDSTYIPLFSGSGESQQGNWFYGLDSNVTVDGNLHPATYRNYRRSHSIQVSANVTHTDQQAYTATGTRWVDTTYTSRGWSSGGVNTGTYNYGFSYTSTPSYSVSGDTAWLQVNTCNANGIVVGYTAYTTTYLAYWAASGDAVAAASATIAVSNTRINVSVSGTVVNVSGHYESYNYTAYRNYTKWCSNTAYGHINFDVTYNSPPSISGQNCNVYNVTRTGCDVSIGVGANANTNQNVTAYGTCSLYVNGVA